MVMPLDVVLVRHGESEHNLANREARAQRYDLWQPGVRARHPSDFRLTAQGVVQAGMAGGWLRREFPDGFDRYYVSTYRRARETAAHLGLPAARWYVHLSLRERCLGELEGLTPDEWSARYAESLRDRERNSFFWRPPGGESIAELCERLYAQILGTLHREMGGRRVLIVSHGETMRAFRFLLERMSVERWLEMVRSGRSDDAIYNCQVLHYTRVNPADPTDVSDRLGWFRAVRPTGADGLSEDWRAITRPTYTNEELLEEAERLPRLTVG